MSSSAKPGPQPVAAPQPCQPPCKQLRRQFSWKEFEAAIIPFADAKEADPIEHWDDYFSAIALAVSLRSKDPNKRVGAVIVSADRVVLSTGYNWLPRGIKELPERFIDKDEKLKWIAHAEANAVFNASRTGISLVGSTIYATTFPCSACAIAIVQAGIVRVFSRGGYWQSDPNGYHLAPEIFADAGVAFDVPRERKRDYEFRAEESAANDPQGAPRVSVTLAPATNADLPPSTGARRRPAWPREAAKRPNHKKRRAAERSGTTARGSTLKR
jgi:dCMP deaminase